MYHGHQPGLGRPLGEPFFVSGVYRLLAQVLNLGLAPVTPEAGPKDTAPAPDPPFQRDCF